MTAPIADPRQFYDMGHQGDCDRTQIDFALTLTPAERLRRHQSWQSYWSKNAMSPDFVDTIVKRLVRENVEFIIVGGVSATLHGSPRITLDLEICYHRTPENIQRIIAALAPMDPRPRGFPPELPFAFDERTLQIGSNFTLVIGGSDLDLLGDMAAIGGYEQVIDRSIPMTLPSGIQARVLSLQDLVATKEAAGRPKNLLALVELKALLEKRDGT